MSRCTSVRGVSIRLTAERWQHIVESHPEMASMRREVVRTIELPEQVQRGDYGELLAFRWMPATPLGPKHLVAVYREINSLDGFVVTAYLTSRPSRRREIVWRP